MAENKEKKKETQWSEKFDTIDKKNHKNPNKGSTIFCN